MKSVDCGVNAEEAKSQPLGDALRRAVVAIVAVAEYQAGKARMPGPGRGHCCGEPPAAKRSGGRHAARGALLAEPRRKSHGCHLRVVEGNAPWLPEFPLVLEPHLAQSFGDAI